MHEKAPNINEHLLLPRRHFLHCINLKDEMVRHNLSLPMGFTTPLLGNLTGMMPRQYPDFYQPYEHNILEDAHNILHGWMTPCGYIMILGSQLRAGMKFRNALGGPYPINTEYIMRKSALEAAFETVRKMTYNHLPCRITCFYIVEDNMEGHIVLGEMFGGIGRTTYDPHVLKVRIQWLLKAHRGDSQWLNQFQLSGEIDTIHQYWRGEPFNDDPRYEYLIEGMLHPCRKADILSLRSMAPVWEKSDLYWRDLDGHDLADWFIDENIDV